MTLDEIKTEIKKLDPNLSEDDDTFKTAVMMLSALFTGQDRQRLSDFTGLSPEFIEPREARLKENGIWVDGKIHADWFEGDNGVWSFWLDVNVAEGKMRRAEAEPGQEPGRTDDPDTPERWQEAVNLAYTLQLLASARQYGLVAGGPEVDLDRCEEILRRGREMGFEPDLGALEHLLASGEPPDA